MTAPDKRAGSASELSALRERVGTATGPDRRLDAEIEAALLGGFPSHLCHDGTRRAYSAGRIHNDDDGSHLTKGGRMAAPLTASIDAAVALVERKWPGVGWSLVLDNGLLPQARIFLETYSCAAAATPALALIAALLASLEPGT